MLVVGDPTAAGGGSQRDLGAEPADELRGGTSLRTARAGPVRGTDRACRPLLLQDDRDRGRSRLEDARNCRRRPSTGRERRLQPSERK